MKRHMLSAFTTGVLALAASGCAKDPLAALRGGPTRLVLSASTLTVNIKDSVAVTATVVDEQGNPLPDAATATSTAPTVVSVSSGNGAPLPVSKFFVKGLLFGNAYVKATVGSITDSMKVIAYPASVSITGAPPDSLASGSAVTLTANPKDAVGGAVANVTPFTWATDVAGTIGLTPSGATSGALGKNPGVANVTVTLPGGANTQVPIRVYSAPFNGSLSASSGNTLDIITVTAAGGGPGYDADMSATLDGVPLLTSGTPNATTYTFAVPPLDATGLKTLVFSNMGPNQFSQHTTFTVNSNSLDDTYEPANNDPLTAPSITADGDYFVILHGDCHPDNVLTDPGLPHDPSDDCDDFFTIANSTGAPIDITATLDWDTDADVDMAFTDAGFTAFENTDGITGNNPEEAEVTIPAGTTFRIWLNLYDGTTATRSFARLRISGMP